MASDASAASGAADPPHGARPVPTYSFAKDRVRTHGETAMQAQEGRPAPFDTASGPAPNLLPPRFNTTPVAPFGLSLVFSPAGVEKEYAGSRLAASGSWLALVAVAVASFLTLATIEASASAFSGGAFVTALVLRILAVVALGAELVATASGRPCALRSGRPARAVGARAADEVASAPAAYMEALVTLGASLLGVSFAVAALSCTEHASATVATAHPVCASASAGGAPLFAVVAALAMPLLASAGMGARWAAAAAVGACTALAAIVVSAVLAGSLGGPGATASAASTAVASVVLAAAGTALSWAAERSDRLRFSAATAADRRAECVLAGVVPRLVASEAAQRLADSMRRSPWLFVEIRLDNRTGAPKRAAFSSHYAARRILEREPEEIMGAPLLSAEFVHDDDVEPLKDAVARAWQDARVGDPPLRPAPARQPSVSDVVGPGGPGRTAEEEAAAEEAAWSGALLPPDHPGSRSDGAVRAEFRFRRDALPARTGEGVPADQAEANTWVELTGRVLLRRRGLDAALFAVIRPLGGAPGREWGVRGDRPTEATRLQAATRRAKRLAEEAGVAAAREEKARLYEENRTLNATVEAMKPAMEAAARRAHDAEAEATKNLAWAQTLRQKVAALEAAAAGGAGGGPPAVTGAEGAPGAFAGGAAMQALRGSSGNVPQSIGDVGHASRLGSGRHPGHGSGVSMGQLGSASAWSLPNAGADQGHAPGAPGAGPMLQSPALGAKPPSFYRARGSPAPGGGGGGASSLPPHSTEATAGDGRSSASASDTDGAGVMVNPAGGRRGHAVRSSGRPEGMWRQQHSDAGSGASSSSASSLPAGTAAAMDGAAVTGDAAAALAALVQVSARGAADAVLSAVPAELSAEAAAMAAAIAANAAAAVVRAIAAGPIDTSGMGGDLTGTRPVALTDAGSGVTGSIPAVMVSAAAATARYIRASRDVSRRAARDADGDSDLTDGRAKRGRRGPSEGPGADAGMEEVEDARREEAARRREAEEEAERVAEDEDDAVALRALLTSALDTSGRSTAAGGVGPMGTATLDPHWERAVQGSLARAAADAASAQSGLRRLFRLAAAAAGAAAANTAAPSASSAAQSRRAALALRGRLLAQTVALSCDAALSRAQAAVAEASALVAGRGQTMSPLDAPAWRLGRGLRAALGGPAPTAGRRLAELLCSDEWVPHAASGGLSSPGQDGAGTRAVGGTADAAAAAADADADGIGLPGGVSSGRDDDDDRRSAPADDDDSSASSGAAGGRAAASAASTPGHRAVAAVVAGSAPAHDAIGSAEGVDVVQLCTTMARMFEASSAPASSPPPQPAAAAGDNDDATSAANGDARRSTPVMDAATHVAAGPFQPAEEDDDVVTSDPAVRAWAAVDAPSTGAWVEPPAPAGAPAPSLTLVGARPSLVEAAVAAQLRAASVLAGWGGDGASALRVDVLPARIPRVGATLGEVAEATAGAHGRGAAGVAVVVSVVGGGAGARGRASRLLRGLGASSTESAAEAKEDDEDEEEEASEDGGAPASAQEGAWREAMPCGTAEGGETATTRRLAAAARSGVDRRSGGGLGPDPMVGARSSLSLALRSASAAPVAGHARAEAFLSALGSRQRRGAPPGLSAWERGPWDGGVPGAASAWAVASLAQLGGGAGGVSVGSAASAPAAAGTHRPRTLAAAAAQPCAWAAFPTDAAGAAGAWALPPGSTGPAPGAAPPPTRLPPPSGTLLLPGPTSPPSALVLAAAASAPALTALPPSVLAALAPRGLSSSAAIAASSAVLGRSDLSARLAASASAGMALLLPMPPPAPASDDDVMTSRWLASDHHSQRVAVSALDWPAVRQALRGPVVRSRRPPRSTATSNVSFFSAASAAPASALVAALAAADAAASVVLCGPDLQLAAAMGAVEAGREATSGGRRPAAAAPPPASTRRLAGAAYEADGATAATASTFAGDGELTARTDGATDDVGQSRTARDDDEDDDDYGRPDAAKAAAAQPHDTGAEASGVEGGGASATASAAAATPAPAPAPAADPAPAEEAGPARGAKPERRGRREGGGRRADRRVPLGMRVLFVDDEAVLLRLGKRFLDKLGCDSTLLDDGDGALPAIEAAIAEGRPFDVVLVDIMMARVGGVEVCEEIRARGIPVPVVAMTAVTGRANLVHFKKVGFNLVLAKPFGHEAVRQALVEAAKRERKRRADEAEAKA